jgi:predicted RNase H-like HicB family nuclease
MNTYDAIARAEEGGWDIEVPAADGSHTWAPTLRKAVHQAREVAAVWVDQPLNEVEVNLVVEGAADEIAAVRHKRDAAEQASRDADEATQAAVVRLTAMGLPDRDVAAVLRLSHQRVQQLRPAGA